MSNIGSSYSKIIHPQDYIRLMSDEHLYISETDKFIIQSIKDLSPPSAEIVELGCGPGRILSLVSEIEGIHLTGVEPDEDFANYSKKSIHKPNIQIVTSSAEHYQHPKKADVFYSQGVHHHIAKGEQTHTYLKNVFNSLKDGGYYILSDEFLAPYADSIDRESKVVVWHAHIIADALKNNFLYLAQEEAKTLLDDLFEGRTSKSIKSQEQIDFVLSKVQSIDEAAQSDDRELTNQLIRQFLETLETYHTLTLQGDMTIDLSRGDYKICDRILRQEIEEANFHIEMVQSIGPIETIGAFNVYILRKG